MVEQYEEYKCKTVNLYLRLKRVSFSVDDA